MQLLDGVAAAVFGVMVPFVIADVTRGTGRFNLSQGIVGTASGLGAAISTSLAGYVSDHFGSPIAFLGLAGIAATGLVLVWALMPETGPLSAQVGYAVLAPTQRHSLKPLRCLLMRIGWTWQICRSTSLMNRALRPTDGTFW